MELYNELRENWERLYWNEGYSRKLAQDHTNYDSDEDDDEDFNPNRFDAICLLFLKQILDVIPVYNALVFITLHKKEVV